MNTFNVSTCYCCRECDKHETNAKFGYIVPCSERRTCPAYQEHLELERAAHRIEHFESAQRAVSVQSVLANKYRSQRR